MKTIEGYDVKIFTDNVGENAIEQIKQLLSIDVFKNCKVRIMPDVHAGAGCVIGFTGNLGDKVIPNIVGVDIGCGILVQPFQCLKEIDFHKFHEFILKAIPSGRNNRSEEYLPLPQKYMERYSEAKSLITQLRCYRDLKYAKRLNASIGSLGGGNHFIEVGKDESEGYYLLVHTGSRNLGKQVAEIYQKLAVKYHSGWEDLLKEQQRIIAECKEQGMERKEIKGVVAKLHASFKMQKPLIPADLSYLEGGFREDYLHDMRLCQQWAVINRRLIIDLLMDFLVKEGYAKVLENSFESIHNYIGDDNIIRKGAISANQGEKCIIPMNMRDGSLICIGKGNEEWNFSAPHGAGRIMSRSQAFKEINMSDFKSSMNGIYSETITEETKDEAPMVYKPMDEIIKNTAETVDIINIVKPIFNFKAAE